MVNKVCIDLVSQRENKGITQQTKMLYERY